jgi:hypothetical protein
MHHIKCHLWPVRLYHIFTDYLKQRQDFRENVFEHIMCALIFSTNLNVMFLILKIIKLNNIANIPRFSCEAPIILV